MFAERDIRAAAIDAVACERKKVVFGAIEYCVTAYNVTKSDCAAALGMGIIELVIYRTGHNEKFELSKLDSPGDEGRG